MSEYRIQFRGTLFPVRAGELTLGRSSYASIVVNNPLASREHAIIRLVGGRLEVVDLGSKNGTMVNGQRLVGSRRIEAGDQVRIGTDVLEIVKVATQDARELRAQTYPGRVNATPDEGETTVHAQRPLDLAEALVAACATESQRASTAETVVQALNEFISEAPPAIPGSEVERVRQIVRALDGWNLGPRLEEWRRSVDERLQDSTGP